MATIKLCSGCMRHGEEILATDWCSTCAELVCETCAKVHSKFNPPHQIMEVGHVEEFNSATDNGGRICETHGRQKMVKFCIRHDCLLCDKCVTESHTHCKTILSIETAAKTLKPSSSVENLQRRITNLQEMSMSIIKRKSENVAVLKNQKDHFDEMITVMKDRIDSHLQKVENDLRSEMTQKFDECFSSIEEKKSKIENRTLELQKWLKHLDLVKSSSQNSASVFRAIKALEGKISKMEEKFNEGKKPLKQEQVIFQAHKNVLKLPSLLPSFGHFIKLEKSHKNSFSGITGIATPPQSPKSPSIPKNPFENPLVAKPPNGEGTPRRVSEVHGVTYFDGEKRGKSASVPSLSTLLQNFSKNKMENDFSSSIAKESPVLEKSSSRHGEKVRKTQSVENKSGEGKISKDSSIQEQDTHDQCLPCPSTKRRKVSLVTQLDASDLGNNVAFGNGCFVPGDRLLLPHYSGQFIYITDYEGKSLLKLKLDYEPWDVVSVNETTAIITMKKKGIQILDLKTMKLSKFIKPGGNGCWAISASSNGIWVERNDNSVHMIDINGNILRKILTQHKLWAFSVSATGNIYYVTSLQSVVYIIKTNGTHEVFYSSSDLREPSSIAVDEFGSVYVSGRGSDNIHRISSDGTYFDIILKRHDGIYRPSALCYNKEDKKLMVINNCNRNCLIFSLQ